MQRNVAIALECRRRACFAAGAPWPHETAMFRDRDLAVRVLGTLLPAAPAARASARLTRALGGARARYAAAAAGVAAANLLGDPAAGAAVEERWVEALAADDLDAWRAWAHAGDACGDAALFGVEHLPAPGPAVFAGFHLSGGLAIFEVLRRRGFAPTFLLAPAPAGLGRYGRALRAVRLRYLARVLERPWIETGPGARRTLQGHLDAGGAVVALLDVPEDAVQLRDRVPVTLFGRTASLPVGILRLALAAGLPIVPFDGRVDDDGRRTIRLHAPACGGDPAEALRDVLASMERVVRERPWDWHAWLEIEALLAPHGA